MKHSFYYFVQEVFPIEDVSLIGDFNGWTVGTNLMQKDDQGVWTTEVDLPLGEFKYKYLVNSSIRMNDPTSNKFLFDLKEEMSSTVIIDGNNERLLNTKKFDITIKDYILSNKIDCIDSDSSIEKFSILSDEMIVCKLIITDVIGIHTISILWYNNLNECLSITENIVKGSDNIDNSSPISQYFSINLDKANTPLGVWTLRLFIDGSFIMEDHFEIVESLQTALDETQDVDISLEVIDINSPINDNQIIIQSEQNEHPLVEYAVIDMIDTEICDTSKDIKQESQEDTSICFDMPEMVDTAIPDEHVKPNSVHAQQAFNADEFDILDDLQFEHDKSEKSSVNSSVPDILDVSVLFNLDDKKD